MNFKNYEIRVQNAEKSILYSNDFYKIAMGVQTSIWLSVTYYHIMQEQTVAKSAVGSLLISCFTLLVCSLASCLLQKHFQHRSSHSLNMLHKRKNTAFEMIEKENLKRFLKFGHTFYFIGIISLISSVTALALSIII
jgi:hypothetical protein